MSKRSSNERCAGFRRSEHGAVLVNVGMMIFGLLAFGTFITDYGILWVSRRQAQNSADAAAHAGAVALAFDNSTDKSATGPAQTVAYNMSQTNVVWGAAPSVIPGTDITFPVCPDDTTTNCIRVDVYRTSERGNPLPTFFGKLVGNTQQDVKAMAVARVAGGNATNCLRPWAVADRWNDTSAPIGKYNPGDTYIPPTPTNGNSTTGYSAAHDKGIELVMKTDPHNQYSSGWFQALDFGSGASTYRNAIRYCLGQEYGVGDIVPQENGNMQGPTQQGMGDLIDLDRDAYWNGHDIVNSCVETGSPCYRYDEFGNKQVMTDKPTVSPRVVPVPIFDPAYYAQTGQVKIVNIVGFFVEDPDKAVNPPGYFEPKFDVIGVLFNTSVLFDGGKGSVDTNAAFGKVVMLVR